MAEFSAQVKEEPAQRAGDTKQKILPAKCRASVTELLCL